MSKMTVDFGGLVVEVKDVKITSSNIPALQPNHWDERDFELDWLERRTQSDTARPD